MSQHRASGGASSPGLGRTSSTTSSSSGYTKPASAYGAAASSSSDLPPPAYSAPAAGAPAPTLAGKRPPPPPPGRPKPAAEYVTALYDFAGQAEGDLSFAAGDKIEIVKKTESDQDWWTGRLNGYEGTFPANYTQ